MQTGGGVDPGVAAAVATSSTVNRPRYRTPTTTSWPTSSATARTRWCPAFPAARSRRTADGDRRGGAGLRAVHEDHRRPADRPAGRDRRPTAGHLAAVGGSGIRVGPRVRQGGAHGEVVRRVDVVPLRRTGLGRVGRGTRTALPGAALAAQDQGGCVRLRTGMCRGARQGRRRHRHRTRLEPLRRRQRRLHAAARGAAGVRCGHGEAGPVDRQVPDVLHPHRGSVAAHGDLDRVHGRWAGPRP